MTQSNGRYTEAVTKDVQNALPQSDQERFAGKDETKSAGPCSLSSALKLKKEKWVPCIQKLVSPIVAGSDWAAIKQIARKEAQSIGLQVPVPASDNPDLAVLPV